MTTHEDEEERDEECHPALDVLGGDEEGGPADDDEERAGQVVRDHVVRHPPRQHHLEPSHAVVACKGGRDRNGAHFVYLLHAIYFTRLLSSYLSPSRKVDSFCIALSDYLPAYLICSGVCLVYASTSNTEQPSLGLAKFFCSFPSHLARGSFDLCCNILYESAVNEHFHGLKYVIKS